MQQVRIGTFNCENLFLRYRFSGPRVTRKAGESEAAYQTRVAQARATALAQLDKEGGPLEWLASELEDFSVISKTQRSATAAVIARHTPDIIALIEVESMEALQKFNSQFLKAKRFPHYMLIDGNDPRGIDVAVLSRFPITHIRSYITDTYKTDKGATVKTFSRDCLVIRADIKGTPLTLFINHFKSQFMDNPDRRGKQAERVAEIVEETFGKKINTERFAVVGDLNDTPDSASLKPLMSKKWVKDPLSTLPMTDRWTHVYEANNKVKSVSQLDYILLSKKLAATAGAPIIERRGLARYKGLDPFFPDAEARILPTVDGPGTDASDHCPVFVDVMV